MLKGLCDWIESKTTLVKGGTLQVGFLATDAPDDCVAVQEIGGGEANFWQTDIEWQQVQVIARGKSYFSARALAREAHGALNGAAGIEFGTSPTIYRASITAVSPPQYIGQDDRRRFEFSTNYRVAVYDKGGS